MPEDTSVGKWPVSTLSLQVQLFSGAKKKRGGSSLNASNHPLIVIDGLTIDNNTPKGMSNPLAKQFFQRYK